MEKPNQNNRATSRVYLVIECALQGHTSWSEVRLFVSSAGNPDVMERAWKCPNGVPTESQTRDMAHYVAKLVTDGTVMFCGVQRSLDV